VELKAIRPNAIIAARQELKVGPQNASSTHSSPKSATPTSFKVPRVTVANKLGKLREIARIEEPSTISDFYDFGSILGRGGFGVVSEILHAKTLRPFAGKVIRKARFRPSAKIEDDYRGVMETLLNSSHSHIVKMLHVFEDDRHFYMVMDVCSGGTLSDFVYRGSEPLPPRMCDDILEQITSGIDFLHRLQILHRDIKPDNVMIAKGSREDLLSGATKLKLRIVDFDMCSFFSPNCERSGNHLEGTVGYLAPEVLASCRYTVASDLFAFGCSAYVVLHRQEPCPDDTTMSSDLAAMAASMDKWLQEAHVLCRAAEAAGRKLQESAQARATFEATMSRRSSPKSGTTPQHWPAAAGTPALQTSRSAGQIADQHGRGASFSRQRTWVMRLEGLGVRDERLALPPSQASLATVTLGRPESVCNDRSSNQPVTPAVADRTPTSLACEGDGDAMVVARLWKLAAWCLQRNPAKRPASAQAILNSGLLSVEVRSPKHMRCGRGGRLPRTSEEKASAGEAQKQGNADPKAVSIDDMLRLSCTSAFPRVSSEEQGV